MIPLIRSIAELVGLACLVAAAFLLSPALGLAVLGVGLILAANFGGRRRDDPSQHVRGPR